MKNSRLYIKSNHVNDFFDINFKKMDMSTVLNTLNILSGQDITKTKLYKTILTADEDIKELLILMSCKIARTFVNFGKSLETTNIYKWLEILFDKFKSDEEIDIKDSMYVEKMATAFATLSSEEFTEAVDRIDEIQFVGHDYATAWVDYFDDDESNINRIAKIIQPLELFILTAITTLVAACHFSQKPFAYYAKMNFKTVVNLLMAQYIPDHEAIFKQFSNLDRDFIDEHQDLEYAILEYLVNERIDRKNFAESLRTFIFTGRITDGEFTNLINVSEKSVYEELKQAYEL